MTHIPESRPAHNDYLTVNDAGHLDVRTHDGSLELLSVPVEVARKRFRYIRSGWPITNIVALLGRDTSEGRRYRLTIERLD